MVPFSEPLPSSPPPKDGGGKRPPAPPLPAHAPSKPPPKSGGGKRPPPQLSPQVQADLAAQRSVKAHSAACFGTMSGDVETGSLAGAVSQSSSPGAQGVTRLELEIYSGVMWRHIRALESRLGGEDESRNVMLLERIQELESRLLWRERALSDFMVWVRAALSGFGSDRLCFKQ